MFKLEITDDRSPERRKPDPVVAREGVFSLIEPEALSPVEAARPETLAVAATKRNARPARYWLPEDILKYVTRIYARFSNPLRKGPSARRK
ncbi:hypothetical protein [Roseinatronobacter monicus]|uniref:Uncharacterized protein n=1 Tax=Roseinatronobacter monicus TaxID=393481 RepID=A0A543K5P3_9RHOB|nr:hypothetical protein [Roseinatronobacter monicus]TQM90391.1 hypothetical protein BD293_3770 [Roseinatronobacter monicus]TQM91476.1 hypothetical protein BD293_0027 [Roseinatronobacter monicus]TQM94919.1 hypothetical protein BD293_3611 [Roseinatronobacter monicus]